MYEFKLPYYISYFLAKVWLAVKKKFLSIRNVLIQISNLSIAYKKNTWCGSRLLCSIILKRMLSDVLIVVQSECKTFARGYKKRIQLGKTLHRFPDFINRKYFTLILKTMILTALVNSVTGMEIFTIQKQPPEVLLKFKSKFHKIHGKTPMPVSLF